MGDIATESTENKWTCPNDRQLVLRAKLNAGWSFHSSGPAKKPARAATISEEEQETIKKVIQRADRIQLQEDGRIGRLVEKLENLRNNAMGNGKETCLFCASKFGMLKTMARDCDICEKNVCEKCGVDTHNSMGQPIWLCMLCSEQRELWKKTGAWFFKAIPKVSAGLDVNLSLKRSETISSNYSERTWTQVRRSKDNLVDFDNTSYDDDDSASSSSEEMLLDGPRDSRANTADTSSMASDEYSLYNNDELSSTPGERGHHLASDTPPEPFRRRSGALAQADSVVGRRRGANSKDGISPYVGDAVDAPRRNPGDEEDIDELVKNYKANEGDRRKDSSGLGLLEFTLRYQKLDSRLDVVLHDAKDLKPMDHGGTSDPYVKLHLLPGASKSNKLRGHTKYKTLNPVFQETLTYYGITEEEISSKTLRLQVFDEDKLGRNDFIGETSINLRLLNSNPTQTFKRNLLQKAYFDTGLESSPALGRIQMSLKYNTQRGMLFVTVIRCSGLAAMDANGYSDPYVKCYLKPDLHKKSKRRTGVKKKTLNPEFNEEFVYDIAHHELAKKTLEVTVWDYDVGKSNDFIGGVILNINAEGSPLKHWYDTLKGPNQLHTHWHTLDNITVHDD